jgi:hypothetical protein
MVRAFSQTSLSVQRLFGADALSQPVILTVMFLLTVNRLVTVLAIRPEEFVEYMAVVSVMGMVAWVIFSLCGFVVNRIAPRVSLTRAVLVIAAYVATGLSREIMLISAPGSTVAFITDQSARLATALITSAVMFTVVANFVGAARSHAASVAEVKRVKAQLAEAIEWSDRALKKTRRALIDLVSGQLRKAFAPFIESKVRGNRVASDQLSELRRVTEAVIRPMSADLSGATPRYRGGEFEISPVRVSISSTLDIATRTNPFRPGLYIWASILIDAPVFVSVLNWTERFWAVVVISALGLVHLASQHTLVPYISKLRFRWRIFIVGAVYNLSLLPISVFMYFVLGGSSYAMWAAGFSFVLGWVFFGTSAAMGGFAIARQKALAEFAASAKLLEWKIARINCQAWVEQRNLATFLHGEVQSLVLVAQLRIQRAIDADDDVETVVAEVQDLLRDVPSRIGTPQMGATLELFREALNDRWGSFLALEFECAENTRRAINADPICLAVTREVLTEFVVNAVKHGRAEHVNLVLSAKEDRVEMCLANSRWNDEGDENSPATMGEATKDTRAASSTGGVGSELVESVLLDRHLTVTPTDYRLTGAIPLQRDAGAAKTHKTVDVPSEVA